MLLFIRSFAVVEVESEKSQRLIMERLDKQELHTQKPVVTHVSKQNLIMFENQSKKNTPNNEQQDPANQAGFQPRTAPVNNARFPVRFPQRMPPGVRPGMPGEMQQPFVAMPNAVPRLPQFSMAPMDPNMVRPPGMAFPGMVPGMMQGMGAPGMPHMQEQMMGGVPVSMQLPLGQAVHGPITDRPDLNALQHMQKPGIAPHVNPAFLPQDDHLGGPGMRMSLHGQGISDMDIESLRRNQSVASTAIQRAMGDANDGDYESGIETLVTAISIIKQSSTANAESSQVLVQSLQDCLHTLEAQLMTKGKSDRDRDDSNRSPPDDYRGDRRSRRRHRSRSRSRSRDRRRSYSPRGRSRSRDRRRR